MWREGGFRRVEIVNSQHQAPKCNDGVAVVPSGHSSGWTLAGSWRRFFRGLCGGKTPYLSHNIIPNSSFTSPTTTHPEQHKRARTGNSSGDPTPAGVSCQIVAPRVVSPFSRSHHTSLSLHNYISTLKQQLSARRHTTAVSLPPLDCLSALDSDVPSEQPPSNHPAAAQ